MKMGNKDRIIRCSYRNCANTNVDKDIRFFSFPKLNCEEWVDACEYPFLRGFSVENLTKHHYVCEDHFNRSDYVLAMVPQGQKNRLKKGVVPSGEPKNVKSNSPCEAKSVPSQILGPQGQSAKNPTSCVPHSSQPGPSYQNEETEHPDSISSEGITYAGSDDSLNKPSTDPTVSACKPSDVDRCMEVNYYSPIVVCEAELAGSDKATSEDYSNVDNEKDLFSGEQSDKGLDLSLPRFEASRSADESNYPGDTQECSADEAYQCNDTDISSQVTCSDSDYESGIGCQTDFSDEEDDNNNNLPIIFCSIYDSVSAVETQCNIPVSKALCKQCGKGINEKDVTTTQDDSSSLLRKLIEGKSAYIPVPVLQNKNLPSYAPAQVIPKLPLTMRGLPATYIDSSNVSDEKNRNSQNFAQEMAYDYENEDVMDWNSPEDNITLQRSPSLPDLEEEENNFWDKMEQESEYIKVDCKAKVVKKKAKMIIKKKGKGYIRQHAKRVENSVLTELLTEMEGDLDRNRVLLTDNEEDNDTTTDINSSLMADWKQRIPKFECDVCNKPFTKLSYLRGHIARVHRDHDRAKEFQFCCVFCRRIYKTQKNLNYHLTLHRGPCEICGKMFKCHGIFYRHRFNHKQCSVCGKYVASTLDMRNHKILAHGKKEEHFCHICDKKLTSRNSLKAHVDKVHMLQGREVKDLKCTKCNYVAKSFFSLRVHHGFAHKRKMTKDSEKYHCRFCNLSLMSKVIRKVHEAKHDGHFKGPKCDLCKRTFSKKKLFDWHKRKFHGIERDDDDDDDDTVKSLIVAEEPSGFPCQSCELCFTSLHLLQAHTHSVHNMPKEKNFMGHQIVYECPYCSFSFYSGNDLQTHMWSMHNVSCNMGSSDRQMERGSSSVADDYRIMEIGHLN